MEPLVGHLNSQSENTGSCHLLSLLSSYISHAVCCIRPRVVTKLHIVLGNMVDFVARKPRVAVVPMRCSPYVRSKRTGRAVPFGMRPCLVMGRYVLGVWHVTVLSMGGYVICAATSFQSALIP